MTTKNQLDALVEYGIEEDTAVELLAQMAQHETSVQSSDYSVRAIMYDRIDSVLAEELEWDLYSLGCFRDHFIAEVTDIDIEVIEALQEAEAFEALGKLIVKSCNMEEFASTFAGYDGYGHFFNTYDGSELELTVDGVDYLVFNSH